MPVPNVCTQGRYQKGDGYGFVLFVFCSFPIRSSFYHHCTHTHDIHTCNHSSTIINFHHSTITASTISVTITISQYNRNYNPIILSPTRSTKRSNTARPLWRRTIIHCGSHQESTHTTTTPTALRTSGPCQGC